MNKKKARKALRKSIKHWCLDIRRPMLNGDTIDDTHHWQNGVCVAMKAKDCALCKAFMTCNNCPLEAIEERCDEDNSAYDLFDYWRDLSSANDMIAILVKCYWRVTL